MKGLENGLVLLLLLMSSLIRSCEFGGDNDDDDDDDAADDDCNADADAGAVSLSCMPSSVLCWSLWDPAGTGKIELAEHIIAHCATQCDASGSPYGAAPQLF